MKKSPFKKESEWEDFDPVDYITGGRAGIMSARITGTSTVDDIKPGDRVFIDPDKTPADGDIVAAWFGDDVSVIRHTAPRLYLAAKDGKRIQRKPVKAKSQISASQTIGVVTGLIRKFE